MATLQSTPVLPPQTGLETVMATMTVTTSSPKVGDFLGGLFTSVNQIAQNALTTAEAVASSAMIKASNELLTVIGQAQVSYEKSMQETVETVDEAIRRELTKIGEMVDDLTKATEEQLGEIERTALALAQTLPIPSAKHNRLISVGPTYIDPTARMVYKLFGSFPEIGKGTSGFVPTLTFESEKQQVSCPLASTPTGTDISFEIPRSVIPEDSLHNYTFLKGKLELPWNDGWVRNHVAMSGYPTTITVLPASPGKVTATIVNLETKKELKAITSGTFALAGSQHLGHPGDVFVQNFDFYPEDGYFFNVQQMPQLNLSYVDKYSSFAWVVIAPTRIVIQLAVACKEGGPCGNIVCSVSAQEYKYVSSGKPPRVEQIDDLKWGETRTVKLDPKTEKLDIISFESFERKKYSYGPVPHQKGMIRTDRVSEDIWEITAVAPTDVKVKAAATYNWGGQTALI